MQKLPLWGVLCGKAGPISVCWEGLFLCVSLNFCGILAFPQEETCNAPARQLKGRFCCFAECSVYDLCVGEAVILIQLPMQKDVAHWLCMVSQLAMRLKVLRE